MSILEAKLLIEDTKIEALEEGVGIGIWYAVLAAALIAKFTHFSREITHWIISRDDVITNIADRIQDSVAPMLDDKLAKLDMLNDFVRTELDKFTSNTSGHIAPNAVDKISDLMSSKSDFFQNGTGITLLVNWSIRHPVNFTTCRIAVLAL